jgi:ABC-type lipoprotein export system ATPase subunit
LFGISKYESGLIEFIRNSDTPITIAIQGEWGSGKTSLMNSLQNILCGDLTDIKNHQNLHLVI